MLEQSWKDVSIYLVRITGWVLALVCAGWALVLVGKNAGEPTAIGEMGTAAWMLAISLFVLVLVAVASLYHGIRLRAALNRERRNNQAVQSRLDDVINSIPEGFAYYGPDDRLVACNDKYRSLYPWVADIIKPGIYFPDLIRVCIERGVYEGVTPDDAAFFQKRLSKRSVMDHQHEQHLADGRWMQVRERRSSEGGIVGVWSDITTIKEREQKLLEVKRRLHVFGVQQKALADMGRQALLERVVRVLAHNTAERIIDVLPADLCQVMEFDHKHESLTTTANVFKGGQAPASALDANVLGCMLLNSDEPLVFQDILTDPRINAPSCQETDGLRGLIALPLRVDGHLYGILTAHRTHAWHPTSGELHFLQAMASVLAAGMERKRAEDTLLAEKERAQVTLESIAEGVITTDAKGRIQTINPTAEALTGWSRREAIGRPLAEVFNMIGRDPLRPPGLAEPAELADVDDLWSVPHGTLQSRDGRRFTIQNSGAPIRDREWNVVGVVMVFEDVTEQESNTRKLAYSATHDSLTGLLNRQEFESRVQRALDECRTDDSLHALCFIDLDRFKPVNDTCGHAAGDELLRQLGRNMRDHLRRQDILARLGGDEFGVLLENCCEAKAKRVATELLETIQTFDFHWEDKTFLLDASIGVIGIHANSGNAAKVLSDADEACYLAKHAGRGRVRFHHPVPGERVTTLDWVGSIQAALDTGRFAIYRQSIQNLSRETADGEWSELLVRMVGEGGVLIPPGAFIPAAERHDLVPQIDLWVLKQALAYLDRQSIEAGTLLSVNVSGNTVRHRGSLAAFANRLEAAGALGKNICFEIREIDAISNLTDTAAFIEALKPYGCRFAIDNFCGGLSSVAYFRDISVDYLKIDGRWVRKARDARLDRAVLESLNRVAKAIGARTVAECVEDVSLIETLRELQIDFAQGFALMKPQPLEPPALG